MSRLSIILVVCAVMSFSVRVGQDAAESKALIEQLRDPRSTDSAHARILALVAKDSSEGGAFTSELSKIIDTTNFDHVWVNAVRLAGELKLVDAIPVLVRVLPSSPYKSAVILGFSDSLTLRTDPVGRSLCDIGDAAAPALGKLLKSDDKETRWRAARVLWNIDTPVSRKILDEDLAAEKDPSVGRFRVPKSHTPTTP